LGIDRLSRDWTESKLGRALFSTPGPTASYYTAHYTQTAPYVTATYVQFVVDRSWNRVVYGNMNGWIKSYNDLDAPTSIAVDPSGRVFVSEAGKAEVSVLALQGDGSNAQLRPLFTIGGLVAPSAVAVSDDGTPLDPSDDMLYVADASSGTIARYALGPGGATLTATFGGFDTPVAIAVGRWNGANNGLLYVVDRVAKRLQVLKDGGGTLTPLAEYRGSYVSYFSSLAVDHFGNVYVADNTSSRLVKLTAALDPLDEEGGQDVYASLAAVSVPFGLITVDGEGTYWAGFDQLFAVERWTSSSGARRRTLGLALKDILFTPDENGGTVNASFTMTDFGTTGMRILGGGTVVRTIAPVAMISGAKSLSWDRKDDAGKLVPPGNYTCELSATNAYTQEKVTATANWTLPLYYEELGGTDDPHLSRGTPAHWGGFSASTDPSSVQYLFTGLTPGSTYQVSAEFVAPPDGAPRTQDLSAGGVRISQPLAVGTSIISTGFIAIPPSSYGNGTLLLSVNARDAGSAVVSRLILKETGTPFASSPDQSGARPSAYALAQNFPNPFNPSTVIRYDLPQAGNVSLKVFDVAGREVVTLVDGAQEAGSYQVRFDATNARVGGLASGVYFYTVRAGNFAQTKKMLLIK
ncbi:MAG TPA: FlgD immunoglobulin-like domain containing protein, partial [Bacteroidota bacterium]|nr:FlgD immunoglobulin-like domain containing protein [Bacteroidota bacterium]